MDKISATIFYIEPLAESPVRSMEVTAACSRGHSWPVEVLPSQGIVRHGICQECYDAGYWKQKISIQVGP